MSVITAILSAIFYVGSSSCFPEGRVVNGTATNIIKYPFMLALHSSNGVHLCGSTLISPRWVLTAAHCVDNRTADQLILQYASTKIYANNPNVISVKQIIVHEDFIGITTEGNDIALLQLEGSLIFNNITLAPVTLPKPYFEIPQYPEGAQGVLVGWGRNASRGRLQHNLQEADLKIYSDFECKKRHSGKTKNEHICGGVDEGGKGQCSGDSGGPLLYNGVIQLGIASWSRNPCTVGPYPGVFTKVSHYVQWINKHIS